MPKEIMYVGKKPTKYDNVNNVSDRVWPGLGSILIVTDAEAAKLTLPVNKDIWMDVTELNEGQRSDVVQELRTKFRKEKEAMTPAGAVANALAMLSTEDMEAELRRRRKLDGVADDNPVPEGLRLQRGPAGGERGGNEPERPSTTEAVVEEIVGAIACLDREKPEHFSEGRPVKSAVVELLGYDISNSELEAALKG